MSEIKKILFMVIFIPLLSYSQTLDTNIFKYFPLNTGNRWTWYIEQQWNPGPGYESQKIIGTRIFNNKVYYQIFRSIRYFYYNQNNIDTVYYRIDSLTGNLYSYYIQNQNECLSDSLNSKKNDSAYCSCPNRWYKCDTGTTIVFNQNKKYKSFGWSNYFEAGGGHIYAKNIGKVYEVYSTVHGSTHWFLRGCLINGIIYGDTNVYIGISKISSEVPKHFSLSQNYPNPFNPITKIKFSIPPVGNGRDRSVKVFVYNVLGRLVQTLVNEQLQPGTYEVDFDGSNFSSGVYYYTLSPGDYFETKRMVLLK